MGEKEGVWGTEVPQRSGVQGQSPVGVWGRSPQKPETNDNFQLRRGDMHPCSPLGAENYAPIFPLATPLKTVVSFWLKVRFRKFRVRGKVRVRVRKDVTAAPDGVCQ